MDQFGEVSVAVIEEEGGAAIEWEASGESFFKAIAGLGVVAGAREGGKAATYAYSWRDAMMHVLDDGRLMLANNLAENEIKSITFGREKYFFCGKTMNWRRSCA